MHWKRWITALAATPLLLLIIFKGGAVFFLLFSIAASTVTLWEYFRIVYSGHAVAVPKAFSATAYITGALMLTAAGRQQYAVLLCFLFLNLIIVAFFSVLRFKQAQDAPLVAVKQVFGVIYIPLSLSFAVMLHHGQDGPLWLVFLIWVVAWGDTGAFYVGSMLGRHKLCPAVSPNKTIEGALGGIVFNILSGVLYKYLIYNDISLLGCLFFSICVGIVGQVGDLFESEFKRASGVKDSSSLLPGHGGFLDRVDALLFALPVGYLIKEFALP